ncbi:MAG: D-alanine--D-alanine ligase family protein [Brevibacterium yomogidense]|uniref:D-alanine--D-alanine ligase n=1 Tax=Brevibacterium yomogidense TaxID=946573 RepID=A0A1X6XJJ4_9MICO|nr:D-alanine--D-alanine ligase family protein [Brevibacterium yomogidense]SLM99495.1 D-alanine--D-alanine ligase [Brevibacterium yomogidense]
MNSPDPRPVVAVLFGGRSSEHSVSCVTAAGVLKALDDERYRVLPIGMTRDGVCRIVEDAEGFRFDPELMPEVVDDGTEIIFPLDVRRSPLRVRGADGMVEDLAVVDVFFPVLHGPFGEDGTVQGVFELMDVPYVGSGVLSSAIGMDKRFMKAVLRDAGVPTSPWEPVTVRQLRTDRASVVERIRTLGSTLFVKPANAGSSMGVTKVSDPSDDAALDAALAEAFAHDSAAIVEPMIVGREIECGVIGTRFHEGPRASVPGEIEVTGADFYDFDTKYMNADAVRISCPADIDAAASARVQDLACRTFDAFDCSGLARVDTFVTESGEVLVNEINTLPGFTPTSMFPVLWEHSGMRYEELVEALVDIALRDHRAAG